MAASAGDLATLTLDKEAKSRDREWFYPVSGKGRRAHLTLGTSASVKPVQTGLDTLEAVMEEKRAYENEDEDVSSFEIEGLGVLRQYRPALWVLYPDEVTRVKSLFAGQF